MGLKVKVSLISDTPVVSCEIQPNVIVSPTPTPNNNNHHSLNFTWYREEKPKCIVHPHHQSCFQCLSCLTLNIPVKHSYFCSTKCFYNSWKTHNALHRAAAKFSNAHYKALGELRSCGSWPCSDFENVATLEQEVKSWTKVGSSRTYVPTPDDVGCILRLESIVVDCKEGNPLTPKNVIATNPVILAPTPRPRCMIQCPFSQPSVIGTFTVLSYNILSDLYASRQLYSYCPTWALAWEYRKKNLLREIIGYEADILCLQEVQSDHFENFLEPELIKRGYSVVYRKKKRPLYTSNRYAIDGCATFFRRDRFREVKKYELDYSELAEKVANALQPSEKQREARIRLAKDNLAIVVILEPMQNGTVSANWDCRFCVANTHIFSNTDYPDVKLWQVASLINGLEKIAAVQVPVLICADLNSVPSSAPHNLVVKGKIDHDEEKSTVDRIGLSQHLKLSHKLHLASAYSALQKAGSDGVSEQQKKMTDSTTHEPLFTNCTEKFFETIDYIFYTEDRFEVKGLLELLDKESARKYTALPSPEWSSDHIALMANFYLKPKSRHPPPGPLPLSLW